ncbi:phosphate acetyltransferase [Jiulongibacter sediminis]|uniref:phosphate acetyltransferase n=1 Tax=Jiulongibacter sediminis TaxID=1605367 RepID=UPI0026EA57A5|nr:phosphate acetyltransferase [Jiulongibacter sediminis]
MTKGIYIATTEDHSGKSLLSLGLMHTLLGKMPKVAFFRPIVHNTEDDHHTQIMKTQFDLPYKIHELTGLSRKTLVEMLNQDKLGEVIDTMIAKYKWLEDQSDFVLVEGTDFAGEGSLVELDLNVLIAKNLGLPVVLIGNGKDKSAKDLKSAMQMAYKSYEKQEVPVLAVISNKVKPENLYDTQKAIQKFLPPEAESFVVPQNESLSKPTMREIVEVLQAKILFGHDYLENKVGSFGVGAMQLRNYLIQIKEDNMVITPGDRADLILGALQANISKNYPKMAGIVLTGGLIPEEPIIKLIEGLKINLPIVSVEDGTFQVANKVGDVKANIYAYSEDKIRTSIELFEEYVPITGLIEKFTRFENKLLTPRMFQYNMVKRAQASRKHIVLPEGNDERILRATALLVNKDLVDITLLGNPDKIKSKALAIGLDLNFDKVNIIDPLHSELFEDFVETIYTLRKHKKINLDIARDLMSDVSYFGTMMIYKGLADGMVSGAVHTTQHTIRPALQFIKTKPGSKVVSSVFFMCLEDRVSVFGDCAINPNPTAEELAEIAISSADSAQAFGIEPKVAMLSYSSGSSGKGEDVDRVREATALVKAKRPDLKVEGPIQYDAAVDPAVGRSKMPDSEVAGQASVLIFPDLNTGNNTYKAVQRETGALAIGPMLQGLNKPVNDLSRGCTVDDIFNTVIITAIQAQGI